jgi:hypothetical protein
VPNQPHKGDHDHLQDGDSMPKPIVEFTTCFHEFSKYESTNFFTNISQLKKKVFFSQF